MTLFRLALSACVLSVVACSPIFNWRDSQPDGSGARLSFPCKPATRTRDVLLAERQVVMRLHSCDTGNATFALTVVELSSPGDAAAALAALHQAAARNIDATSVTNSDVVPRGTTSGAAIDRFVMQGRLPDGSVVRQDTAFLQSQTRVYQATILSKPDNPLPADVADTFFDSIVVAK